MADLQKLFDNYKGQIMKAAIGSVAKLTPPAQRKEYDAKKGIRRLREKIKKQYGGDNILEAAPAGPDSLFTFGQYNDSGIYVKKKGGKRKERASSVPYITSGESLIDWYISHSKIDKTGQRKKTDGAVALVSGKNVITAAIKKIQSRAGNLISGWEPFAKYFGGNIGKHLLKGNFDYNGDVQEEDGIIYAYNFGQSSNPALEKYVQYIIDRDLPKQIEYHERQTAPFLVKSIKKNFDISIAEAKAVVTKIVI